MTDDFAEMNRAERRLNRQAARLFASAVASGDFSAFMDTAQLVTDTCDGWRLAFRRIGRMTEVTEEIRWAFLWIWIEQKGFHRRVNDRPGIARALRVLLPRSTTIVEPLRLWRGASAQERRKAIYGFSWSKDQNVARSFAESARIHEGGAVLLETLATPDAILHIREPSAQFNESEVIVDPYALGPVRVIERLPH